MNDSKLSLLVFGIGLALSHFIWAGDHATTPSALHSQKPVQACTQYRKSAPLMKHMRRSGLDPHWNQEYSGYDLVQIELPTYEKNNSELKTIPVALVEVKGEPFHSAAVKYLFEQNTLKGKIAEILYDSNEENLIQQIKQAKKNSEIVNFSQSIGRSDTVFEQFSALTEKDIAVLATGDRFPQSPELNDNRVNAISVGSLNPLGFMSHFTEEPVRSKERDDGLDILVPADVDLLIPTGIGKYELFGYDSGAAPQVSGFAGDISSILPGIGVDEFRFMLIQSAISDPQTYWHLNAYHLYRWALNLREKGGSDGWRRFLYTEHPIKDFNREAKQLMSLAEKKLSEIEPAELLQSPQKIDCDKLEEAIRLIRKAFLLTKHSTTYGDRSFLLEAKKIAEAARMKLVLLYETVGLPIHSEYYQNLDRKTLLANLERYILNGDEEDDGKAAVRQAAGLGKRGDELVYVALDKGTPAVQEWAVYSGVEIAKAPFDFLTDCIDFAENSMEDRILYGVASSLSGMKAERSSEYLVNLWEQAEAEQDKGKIKSLKNILLKKFKMGHSKLEELTELLSEIK